MENLIYQKAKQYARAKHTVAIAKTVFILAFLLIVYFSGISGLIAEKANSFSDKHSISLIFYLLFFSILLNIFVFVFDYLSGYRLEHFFKLSRQSFSAWFKDYLKALLISGVFALILIETVYFFMRVHTPLWWVYSALIWIFASIVLAKIFPTIIIPLFYKIEPFDNEKLKQDILLLAEKTKVKILDIYKINLGAKTSKANAAVTGLGKTKRILLADTLLDNYTEDEIKATLGHELAHNKFNHFWKIVFFNLLFTFFIFLCVNYTFLFFFPQNNSLRIYNLELYPVLFFMFMLYGILLNPAQNLISCFFEFQADKEAVKITGNKDAFASLIEKLTKQNLSDPKPPKLIELFFYDHPPSAKRIKAIKTYN